MKPFETELDEERKKRELAIEKEGKEPTQE